MISGNLHADTEQLYLDSGVIKVADFGLSKSLVPVDRHGQMTVSLTQVCTQSLAARLLLLPVCRAACLAAVIASTEAALRPGASASALPLTACQVYKLTGETGSYRYMAPEVFRCARASAVQAAGNRVC